MPGPESYNFPVLQGTATDVNIETPRSQVIGEGSRYDVNYFIPIGGLTAEEIQQTRAENQGALMELGTAAANLIPNTALSIVESAAHLADLEDWSNMIQGNAANYGNVLTEWASRNKNVFGEVYQKTPGENNIMDSAWWISNGAGLVESVVAFGLTGYGVGSVLGKGASALSKSLNAYGKAKMGLDLAAQIGTSGTLAFTEGAMTGAQVFKDVYSDAYNTKRQEILNQGAQQYGEENLTEEYYKYADTAAKQFANEVAGESATKAVRINTGINTFLNLPETGALFRSMSANRYLDDALKLQRGESAKDAIERIKSFNVAKHLTREGRKSIAKQMGGEALEEMVNVYAEEEGKNVGRKAMGRNVTTLAEMLADDDIWAAGFWGAIGGSMQGFVMNKMPKWVTQEDGTTKRTTIGAYNKEQVEKKYEEQIGDLTDRLTEFVTAKDNLLKASQTNDEKLYNESINTIFKYNSFNSIVKGVEEQLIGEYENIMSLSTEQAAQQGFKGDYKQDAAKKIQSIREYTNEWNKIQDRYMSQDLDMAGYPETIFQQFVNVENNKKIITEQEFEINKLQSDINQSYALKGTDLTIAAYNDIVSSIRALDNDFELETIDLENLMNLDRFDSQTRKRIIAKLNNKYGNLENAKTQIEKNLQNIREKARDFEKTFELQRENFDIQVDPENKLSQEEKDQMFARILAENEFEINALTEAKSQLQRNRETLRAQEDELRQLKSKEGVQKFKDLKKQKLAEQNQNAETEVVQEQQAQAEAEREQRQEVINDIRTRQEEAPETVTEEEIIILEQLEELDKVETEEEPQDETYEEGGYTGEGSSKDELEEQYEDISKVANNSDIEGEIIDSSGVVISVGDRLIEGSNKLAYASTVEYVEEDGKIKHTSLKLNPETNPDLLTDKYIPGTKLKIKKLRAEEFKPFVAVKDIEFIDELGREILVANAGQTVTFDMLSHPYMQPIGIYNEAGEYQAMLHATSYITPNRIVPANVADDLQALINIRAAVTDQFQDITINSKSNGKLNQLPQFYRLSELIDQPVEFAIATSTIQLNTSKTTPVENLANKKGFKVGQVYGITVMADGRKLAIPVKTTKVKESPEVFSELMAALDTFLQGGNRGNLQNVFGKYLHSVFSSDKLTEGGNSFKEDPNGKDRVYIDFTSSNVDGIIFGRAGFSKKFISGNSPVGSIEALRKELASIIQESYININFEALKNPDFVKYFVTSNVRFYPLPNNKVTVFDNPVIGFDTSNLLNATAPATKVTAEPTPIVTPTPTTTISNIEAKKADIERRRQEEYNTQYNALVAGQVLDNQGDPVYEEDKGIGANGLSTLTDKKYGHGHVRTSGLNSLKVLESLLDGSDFSGMFGQIGIGDYSTWESGKFIIVSNNINPTTNNKLNLNEIEVILNAGLSPFAQELANKYPNVVFKDFNGKKYDAELATPTTTVSDKKADVEKYRGKSKFTSKKEKTTLYLSPSLSVENSKEELKNTIFDLLDVLSKNKDVIFLEGGIRRIIESSQTWYPFSVLGDYLAGRYKTSIDKVISEFKKSGFTENELEIIRQSLENKVSPYAELAALEEPQSTLVVETQLITETPIVETQPTPSVKIESANGASFTIRLDEDDDYSLTTAEDIGIKPGVSELFESNPELANSVYEALGFNQMITPNDRIVFGHPTIGKSFLKNQGEDKFISLDDDYATEINSKVKEIADKYNVTTYQVKDGGTQSWNNEYNQMMQEMFNVAKQRAISENKTLFTSNTNLLRSNAESFDKVINLTDKEFERRIQERGAKYDIKEWKSQINKAISKLPTNKVINTDKYLSDLFITPQQKQQAQQLYSQYLDSIFPDSKEKDIFYHGLPFIENKDDFFRDSEDDGSVGRDNEVNIRLWNYFYKNRDRARDHGDQQYAVILNFSADFDSKELAYKANPTFLTNDSAIVIAQGGDEYVVKSKKQIHILGSKQDVEGFKKFVDSGKQIEKSVSLQDKVNTLIQEGKATKFCK